MKLNNQGKNELRAKIEEQLQRVPEGKRVHLDKELLENLLFETITYNKNTNEKLKLPIWTGEFLRKIDLSEVSFEDVAWSLVVPEYWDSPEEDYEKYMDEETFKELPNILPAFENPEDRVDYSMTNAKIDFSKSFEFKKTGGICLLFCNFDGVNLSNNDMSKIKYVHTCDLSNTGILLTPDMFVDKGLRFGDTYLENVDLSKFTIDAIDLIYGRNIFDRDCYFTNTRLNVTLNSSADEWHNEKSVSSKNRFKDVVTRLVGCYINGKKVLSSEEKQAIVKQYQDYKQGVLDSVSSSIDEQVGQIKR